ncbi:MAG TPA: entericidin A/B family lipoprotein [Tepidisphaeraceae bacterium]|jgi:predicted small secreted protein
MDRLFRMLSVAALTVVLSAFSIACNTTEGAGKDIEATGDAIKSTARDAKN